MYPGAAGRSKGCAACAWGWMGNRPRPLCGDPGWDYVNSTDDRDGMVCRIGCNYRWTAADPGWRAQVRPRRAPSVALPAFQLNLDGDGLADRSLMRLHERMPGASRSVPTRQGAGGTAPESLWRLTTEFSLLTVLHDGGWARCGRPTLRRSLRATN